MHSHYSLSLTGIVLSILGAMFACGGKTTAPKVAANSVDIPTWITRAVIDHQHICGIGVAGAGFDENSPYPKEMALGRAVRNIAGILGTTIQEAIIDKQANDRVSVEMARSIHIDEELIERIAALVETEYWLDRTGAGPFAQKNFVYAHACAETGALATKLKIDTKKLSSNTKPRPPVTPEEVPKWMTRTGTRPDGRLCAVGFSLPTFHPDATFEGVVEDVRVQLSTVIETLVSSYSEELTNNRNTFVEMMTVASTQAIAKGVVVSNYWYDRDGRGPFKKTRSTYGWGCIYPMEVLQQSLAVVEKQAPDKKSVAIVRERAANAFADLEVEIAKHEAQ